MDNFRGSNLGRWIENSRNLQLGSVTFWSDGGHFSTLKRSLAGHLTPPPKGSLGKFFGREKYIAPIYYLAIFFVHFLGWLSDPLNGCSWPPTRGWKGHFESPGIRLIFFAGGLCFPKLADNDWNLKQRGLFGWSEGSCPVKREEFQARRWFYTLMG